MPGEPTTWAVERARKVGADMLLRYPDAYLTPIARALDAAREEGRRAGFIDGAEAMRTAAVLCCATEQGGGWAAARIIRIEPSTLPGALATKEPA